MKLIGTVNFILGKEKYLSTRPFNKVKYPLLNYHKVNVRNYELLDLNGMSLESSKRNYLDW